MKSVHGQNCTHRPRTHVRARRRPITPASRVGRTQSVGTTTPMRARAHQLATKCGRTGGRGKSEQYARAYANQYAQAREAVTVKKLAHSAQCARERALAREVPTDDQA